MYWFIVALEYKTGIQPATNASNTDFRVIESPVGAGQKIDLLKSIIVFVAFKTPLQLWAVLYHRQSASSLHCLYKKRLKLFELGCEVFKEPINNERMSLFEFSNLSQGKTLMPSYQWKDEG